MSDSDNQIEYHTEYYKDPTLMAILMIAGFGIFITFIIWACKNIGSNQLALMICFGTIILFLVVLIILKPTLLKNAIINYNANGIGIKLYEKDSNNLYWEYFFLWQDMIAYRFYFDTKLNTCITLYLKNKKKQTFIFKDNKTYEQAISENSVLSNFYSFVSEFNKEKENGKILPKQNFLATNRGYYLIWFEVVLMILALIILLVTKRLSYAFYIFGTALLLIPQIFNRQRNKEMFEKMSSLKNDSILKEG